MQLSEETKVDPPGCSENQNRFSSNDVVETNR